MSITKQKGPTGIARKIDDLGRLVLPIEMRKALGIKKGDPVEMLQVGKTVVLKPHKEGKTCHWCQGSGKV